jgi:hypothetical protein
MVRRVARAALGWLLASPIPLARAQWVPDGAPVCDAPKNQSTVSAIEDGAGGAILVWTDARNSTTTGDDIFVQRMDISGHAVWTPNGVPVCAADNGQSFAGLVSDGAGGAIVAWIDSRLGGTSFDIYAQRVNAAGVPQWTPNGVPICTASGGQYYPKLASNGAGGALIAWLDNRAGSLNSDVYAARVTGAGTALDGTDGIPISMRLTNEGPPAILPFGAGGALIAWGDARNGVPDVYAARLSSAGVVLDPMGLPICVTGGDQVTPAMVQDGAGGAIMVWSDGRVEGLYAQRINSAGAAQWTQNGVPIPSGTAGAIFQLPPLLPDGAGGAILAWLRIEGSDYNVYAQRINATGGLVWAPDAVPVCTGAGEHRVSGMASDDAGGVIIVWEDRRFGSFGYDIYAQRVRASGAIAWAPNGVPVCQADFDQHYPVVVADTVGGAIVAWEDARTFPGIDVYAQRVATDGVMPTAAEPLTRPAFTLLPARPNPFGTTTDLTFQLAQPATVSIEVFDVAGRRVRAFTQGAQPDGWRTVSFDGRDDDGQPLPSGVYFCRVDVAGQQATQSLVLAK